MAFAIYNNQRYDADLSHGKCTLIKMDKNKMDDNFEIIGFSPQYAQMVEVYDPKLISLSLAVLQWYNQIIVSVFSD